jgi:hypothetical protein
MAEKQTKLHKIVSEFTKGLLGKKKSKGMCYTVCVALQGYLEMCGYKTEIIEGEIEAGENIYQHFWLKLGNQTIIDPTADQFNELEKEKMPRIFIGKQPIWYWQKEKELNNHF